MYKLLTSETLIKRLSEDMTSLTDKQIATLVITSYLPFEDKQERLRHIIKSTDDDCLAELLAIKIRSDQEEIEEIERNANGVVFILTILSDGLSKDYLYGVFYDCNKAIEVGKNQGKDFKIDRFSTNCEGKANAGALGYVIYDFHGHIQQFCSYETAGEDEALYDICYQYIDIPKVYEIGNIVRVINTGEIGIVTDNCKVPENGKTPSIDDSRIEILVINCDSSFCRKKVLPTYLEAADEMDYVEDVISIMGIKQNKLHKLLMHDE